MVGLSSIGLNGNKNIKLKMLIKKVPLDRKMVMLETNFPAMETNKLLLQYLENPMKRKTPGQQYTLTPPTLGSRLKMTPTANELKAVIQHKLRSLRMTKEKSNLMCRSRSSRSSSSSGRSRSSRNNGVDDEEYVDDGGEVDEEEGEVDEEEEVVVGEQEKGDGDEESDQNVDNSSSSSLSSSSSTASVTQGKKSIKRMKKSKMRKPTQTVPPDAGAFQKTDSFPFTPPPPHARSQTKHTEYDENTSGNNLNEERDDILWQLKKLKKFHHTKDIPHYDEYTPLHDLKRIYKEIKRDVLMDESVNQLKEYTMLTLLGVEKLCTSYLSIDVSGFANNELQYMDEYHKILSEMSERSYITWSKDLPSEIKLVRMILTHVTIFAMRKEGTINSDVMNIILPKQRGTMRGPSKLFTNEANIN
jgi:hypothetical protein